MDKVQQPIEAARVIDEDLYELLLLLQTTKKLHRDICSRMRLKGVSLDSDSDSEFEKLIDEVTLSSSYLVTYQFFFDIHKGPER